MGIDKPWEHNPAGGVDDEIAIRYGISVTRLNGNDIAPIDHDAPIVDDKAHSVHCKHEPVLNCDARHRNT
jgi:hypothetical protein